jgi:hypothetical protein
MHPKKSALHILVPTAFLLVSASAAAQDAASPVYTEPAPVVYTTTGAPVPPAAEVTPADGPRFRFGIDFAGGFEKVDPLTFWLVGANLRLGVQLNDMIGIYVMPHFSGGKLTGGGGGIERSTGTFAATAGVDITLWDRLFFGGGFGYGVLNNPSGPVLGLRVGGYLVSTRPNLAVPRRKGLAVGMDFRAYFVGGAIGTGVQMMFTLGYEAF